MSDQPLLAARGAGRRFGEMVALLWADGNYDAAIRLEELWNDLQETYSFSLFCSYPMNGFGGEALAKPLSDVCAGHSQVIPAESYTALIDPDDRLRAITLLQQKARSLEGLGSAARFLRAQLSKALHLRTSPELHFHLDKGLEHAQHIDRVLKELKESDD